VEEGMYGKLVKWGNGVAIRLPASVLDAAGLALSEEVQIVADHGVVQLRSKSLRRLTIEEMFAEAEKDGRLVFPEVDEHEYDGIAPTDKDLGIVRDDDALPDTQRE
jgi:antitoxin component of MazEF toxin-antitoxin module